MIQPSSQPGSIDVLDDRRPDDALGWVIGPAGLAADAEDGADGRADRSLVAADDDDRRRAMAGDVGARGVSDKAQVLMGEEVLDELGAELALHERVAGDLADPAGPLAALGQGEEQRHERHGERVLALADVGVLGAVDLVEGLVLDGDVGRVADDDVVAAFFQHGQEERAVLGGVGEGHEGAAVAHAGQDVGVGAVDEGVADGQVEGERRGGLQRRKARGLERGDGEPEAGDRDGERVEVDAVDRVERRLDAGLDFQAGRVPVPAVEQAVEGAEQEVAGPAGRVDELEAFQGPLLQRWFEGAVEDELLDEDRGLQQRVGVLRVLGQVLVQVAEEPGGQRAYPPGRGRARRPRCGAARSRAAS